MLHVDDAPAIETPTPAPPSPIGPDLAVCAACAREVRDPFARRFRYPFATCRDCGPRVSVSTGTPFVREFTTLAAFAPCPECTAEMADPADRHFGAATTACHRCGPRARLVRTDGRAASFEQFSMLDDVDAALGVIQRGEIVAVKGVGGFQLACDATRADVVADLRRKKRSERPFALMARDLDVIRRYCQMSALEESALTSPLGPIVILDVKAALLPDGVAPGLHTLGFMLPTTPLHVLMLRRMERPIVMTSANLAGEPTILADVRALADLAPIASYALVHDREVTARAEDPIVRVIDGQVRVLRRGRGQTPGAGGMNVHSAAVTDGSIGGHHALVAACLAEHDRPVDAVPVLGIVLDEPNPVPGIEAGEDGVTWGGEFLIADFRTAKRVGTFKPVALLGEAPWCDLYAHLMAEIGWPALVASYAQLDLFARLSSRPRAGVDEILRSRAGAPRASSCGRLFDAVAAAVGVAFERRAYPGEAMLRLCALAASSLAANAEDDLAYPFAIPRLGRGGLPYLEPAAMWSALLGDLILDTPPGVIAARFHHGLAKAIVAMALKVGREVDTVVLAGACFQNRILHEDVARRLRASGFQVLGHTLVPAGDDAVRLGQAAIGAARLSEKGRPCASASRVGS